jgi:DNA-directed RNA polymerase I, II, and III subunit RPABC2
MSDKKEEIDEFDDNNSDSGSDVNSNSDVDIDFDDDDNEDDDDDVEIEDTFDSDDEEVEERGINQNIEFSEDDDDDSESENEDEHYLQKFKESLKTNVISEHHPELIIQNFEEVNALCTIVRDQDGIIMDPMHRTLPFITKYEKAKILGERAKQLNAGAEPFVEVGYEIIDGYLIALAEFEQKKIPMIIRRPLPNGGSEFWRLADLEVL